MAITERRGKQQNCRKGRSIPYRRGMKSLVFQISERGLRVGPMDQRKVGCGALIKNKRDKAGASPVCSHLLSSCGGDGTQPSGKMEVLKAQEFDISSPINGDRPL